MEPPQQLMTKILKTAVCIQLMFSQNNCHWPTGLPHLSPSHSGGVTSCHIDHSDKYVHSRAHRIQTLTTITPIFSLKADDPAMSNSSHWGQGPVFQASTLQVHCKEMDKVPCMCPPSTSQVHSEFSLPVFLQFPWSGECPVRSQCPGSHDYDVPINYTMGTS